MLSPAASTNSITCGTWVQRIRHPIVTKTVWSIEKYCAAVQEGDLLRVLIRISLQPPVHDGQPLYKHGKCCQAR
jgi:hypothetical protein